MTTVRIYLKSGLIVETEVGEFIVKKQNGRLTGVEWVRPPGALIDLIHVDSDAIEAVVEVA